MKETSPSISSVIVQSPVPGFVMMLQYLFHQKNISSINDERIILERENSRLQALITELEGKLQSLELQLQTQVKQFQKLLTEKQEPNCTVKEIPVIKIVKEEPQCTHDILVPQVVKPKPRETLKKFIEVFLKKKTGECNKNRALIFAARSNDLALTSALVDVGTDINTEDYLSWNRTPLHWAAVLNYLDIARILIEGGANIEPRETGVYNLYTPLHEAAKYGHLSMCRLLLDTNADPNSIDGTGSTPLHIAARNGQLAVVKLLVDRGATVSAKDNWGSTARDRATRFAHREVVDWLSWTLKHHEQAGMV